MITLPCGRQGGAVRIRRQPHLPAVNVFEQQAIIHLFEIVLVLQGVMAQERGLGFFLGFVRAGGDKQAKFVCFGELMRQIAADIDEIQTEAAIVGAFAHQRHGMAIRPIDNLVAINVHCVGIAKLCGFQRGNGVFHGRAGHELHIVHFDI